MKRSIALESLRAAIDFHIESNRGNIFSDKLAEFLLNHCENVIGMNPPSIENVVVPYNNLEFKYTELVNEWED